MLNDSAKAVRDAVRSRVEAGRDMDLHYDHPILLLQHMLWHEGYHHGQMKLALKVAGLPPGRRGDRAGHMGCLDIDGMAIAVIRDGQIQEGWNCFDFMSLYQQVGMLPPLPVTK